MIMSHIPDNMIAHRESEVVAVKHPAASPDRRTIEPELKVTPEETHTRIFQKVRDYVTSRGLLEPHELYTERIIGSVSYSRDNADRSRRSDDC